MVIVPLMNLTLGSIRLTLTKWRVDDSVVGFSVFFDVDNHTLGIVLCPPPNEPRSVLDYRSCARY